MERTNEEFLSLLINQLDKWIDDSEKQYEMFGTTMVTAGIASQAMAQAYWNIKQFILINKNKYTL